jgi:hypothetical protein
MGIDYEKGRFTAENYEVLPAQAEPLIRDMQPGEISYVDIDHYWTDYDRRVWVNGNSEQYTLDEIKEHSCPEDFARIICTHDGFVLDFSHFDRRDWSTNKILRLEPNERFEEEIFEPIPMVYFITNKDELEVVSRIMETYNIILDGSELEDVHYEHILSGESDEDDEFIDDDED